MPSEKESELERLAQSAIEDEEVLAATLQRLVSKDEAYRYRCSQVLF
jgi:hypothetical protein